MFAPSHVVWEPFYWLYLCVRVQMDEKGERPGACRSIPCPPPERVEVTCYNDDAFVKLTFRPVTDSEAHARYSLSIPTPVGASEYTVVSPHVSVESTDAVSATVEVDDTSNVVLLSGRDSAASALPPSDVQYLSYPETWHALTTRKRLEVVGSVVAGALNVCVERTAGPGTAAFTLHVAFRIPPLEWRFFHELAVATDITAPATQPTQLATMIRLTGSADLFGAYLRKAFGVPTSAITFNFVNKNLRLKRRAPRAKSARRAESATEEDDARSLAPAVTQYYAARAEPDAAGRWAVRNVTLSVGSTERTFRALATPMPIRLYNVFYADNIKGSPDLHVVFDRDASAAARSLLEPGSLVVLDAAAALVLGEANNFDPSSTPVLNAGPLQGVRIEVTRTVDNKRDGYHEERVTVSNTRSVDSSVALTLVQRNASKVELLEPAKGRDRELSVRGQVAATLLEFDRSARIPTGFVVPIVAKRGFTTFWYRWYDAE